MANRTTILLLILALSAVSASALQLPININCGTSGETRDSRNMTWVGDQQYVRSGRSGMVRNKLDSRTVIQPLNNVRYFPSRKKNCYSFPGVGQGKKIFVRGWFYYGNYDGMESLPTFDVLLNGNRWGTVQQPYGCIEAVLVTKVDEVSICLARTNPNDVPFINSIQIMPLDGSMYKEVDNNSFPLFVLGRNAYGIVNGYIRYPDDSYDRIWNGASDKIMAGFGLRALAGSSDTKIDAQFAPDEPPAAVVRDALTTSSGGASTLPILGVIPGSFPCYINFYFMEVLPNASRSLDILLDGRKFYPETIHVPYGRVKEISRYGFNLSATSVFTLVRANGSTHPPLINAAEFFVIGVGWRDDSTDHSDVKALSEIQKSYVQLQEWSGDPCLPAGYAWEWVGCSNDSTPRVTALNLSGYGLTGPLVDLSSLAALQTIDLHNNSLSGSIPGFLGKLPNLKQLDLADNRFSGSVPESLTHNPKISLNISGYNTSGNNVSGNSKDFASSSQKKTDTAAVAGAAISVLLFLLLLVILAIFIFKKRPSAKRSSVLLESENKHEFSHAEIVEITNNFEKALGEGGSGNVYHGKLENGTEVAVKVLKDSLARGTKEFVCEAKLLMTVHHRCLVSFVGYCEEGGKLILLYEYMSGGNLRQILSGKSGESAILTWETRLQIALRVATGLDYLHSGCYPPIIHRDVKTTNILLNEKMEAKLADFGLSKVGQKEDGTQLPVTAVTSPPKYTDLEEYVYSLCDQKGDVTQLSTAIAGTPGYIDPEYYSSGQVSKKSDVYSFGVVLFELITGHPPIFKVAEERFHLVQWIKPRLAKGNIHGVADPKLTGQYNVNSLWKVADIATSCTSQPSHSRPNISDVVDQLKEAIEAQNAGGQYKSPDTPFAEVQLASSSSYDSSFSFPSGSHAPPAR
ncbi:unnamed protein product [Victoria cruziana]